MTLKEELEVLRGEPIKVFTGDPIDIPCIETSDPEKLCRHPVVSVQMCTYNHEPYIRQAIEGVMMQKADFEFELVIGEDCSQDKTREICFEYQKRYPDKIRVLWWHENVSKLGGNSRRVYAHARGEFIALCEGDDYWIDPLKLQKQVDVLRIHPDVSLVASKGDVATSDGTIIGEIRSNSYGKVPAAKLQDLVLAQFWFGVITPAMLCRRSVIEKAVSGMPFSKMRLRCGDTQNVLAALTLGDVYIFDEKMFAYRRHGSSVTGSPRSNYFVGADGLLVRYAYSLCFLGKGVQDDCRKRYLRYVVYSGRKYVPALFWIRIFLKCDMGLKICYIKGKARNFLKRMGLGWLRVFHA